MEDTIDYTIHDTREMLDHMSGITTVLTGFLSAMAGVSLLVAASASSPLERSEHDEGGTCRPCTSR